MTRKQALASITVQGEWHRYERGEISVQQLCTTLQDVQEVFHVEPFCVGHNLPQTGGKDMILMPGVDWAELPAICKN